ncbi:MAG: serine recombinase [Hydrocarboniphaga sp.]|uniref:recombinase family protein n=1 Tax=Hydrocarboniphaga sp. TaxID=2033016 RepID=UPI0026359E81|nr:recombinase family protein [Hydrocarboniphaga sp.]MDB5971723.1 serine recombinase [Hydrocarboniphaga sp.]
MSLKITPDHLSRGAVVYVRQSSAGQVIEHTESQRRQYALAETARQQNFASVTIIDDDLGRSGSGLVERPGFQKLVASVCGGLVGAVYCIEASRLARNGRDWHHLIDLCALVGALVIDPDGVYDPRLINDRLLLGLKGTMSEYELNLLQQRGLAARDSKAKRGELRFALPPGYCWNELGQIEKDPDERVAEAIQLVFRKFRELGSARQVLLWAKQAQIDFPVLRQRRGGHSGIEWKSPAYHTVIELLQHPVYAGAYVFGRTAQRTHVVDGRARKTVGHKRPIQAWSVLLQDHHPGYISWQEFEENQTMISENAHMQSRTSRKSARGGKALLTGLVRCGRCGRMMRVLYSMQSGHAHRYQCRGDIEHGATGLCIGIGGMRIDRAVASQILDAVSNVAVEAAIHAVEQVSRADDDIRLALLRELEEARYQASLAARRHEAVDPAKRLVARELEARWNAALEHVAQLEQRIVDLDAGATSRPKIDRQALMALAYDLPSVWNAPGTDPRTKQRLTRILVQEVVIDLDDASNEAVVTVHWVGGRHTEIRVARVRCGRYPEDRYPSAVEVLRKLGGQWSDRELAVTMNRMRCKSSDGQSWTTVRVRQMRERLDIAAFDPAVPTDKMISVGETARRLQICAGSVHRLIREGVLPASQIMPSAPWQIPLAALDTQAVKIGVRSVMDRRPQNFPVLQDGKTLKLPGF